MNEVPMHTDRERIEELHEADMRASKNGAGLAGGFVGNGLHGALFSAPPLLALPELAVLLPGSLAEGLVIAGLQARAASNAKMLSSASPGGIGRMRG